MSDHIKFFWDLLWTFASVILFSVFDSFATVFPFHSQHIPHPTCSALATYNLDFSHYQLCIQYVYCPKVTLKYFWFASALFCFLFIFITVPLHFTDASVIASVACPFDFSILRCHFYLHVIDCLFAIHPWGGGIFIIWILITSSLSPGCKAQLSSLHFQSLPFALTCSPKPWYCSSACTLLLWFRIQYLIFVSYTSGLILYLVS